MHIGIQIKIKEVKISCLLIYVADDFIQEKDIFVNISPFYLQIKKLSLNYVFN